MGQGLAWHSGGMCVRVLGPLKVEADGQMAAIPGARRAHSLDRCGLWMPSRRFPVPWEGDRNAACLLNAALQGFEIQGCHLSAGVPDGDHLRLDQFVHPVFGPDTVPAQSGHPTLRAPGGSAGQNARQSRRTGHRAQIFLPSLPARRPGRTTTRERADQDRRTVRRQRTASAL